MVNKFQAKFIELHSLTEKKSKLLEELQTLFPNINSYRVFGAFKRVMLSRLSKLHLTVVDAKAVKILTRVIKQHEKNVVLLDSSRSPHSPRDGIGYDISSYVSALGLGFIDSIILAREFKSHYLLEQFLWRAFYYQADINDKILQQYKWKVNRTYQSAFFAGKTGYALVDAAIVCLRKTGKLPNKLRMVVASFFCKNLLQPWMYGEKFFARYLEDYDKAVNRGNWIWCSQLRYDNQPFVRFFHPDLQLKKLLKNPTSAKWYEEWKQPEHPKIIDWKESCMKYRKWKASHPVIA